MNEISQNYINNLYGASSLPSLNLTQIDGFEPVQQFTDSSGQTWKLIKSANSGMCEIPDPRNLNIVDYWNHEHPSSSGKVFLYVVEGVRIPKTSREQACKILYCWFSQVNNKSFTPQMIKANEWLLANVYASEITDARVSKLKAICKYEEKTQPVQTVPQSVPEQPTPLIDIGLINDTGTRNKTESNDSDNKRERRTNNRQGND